MLFIEWYLVAYVLAASLVGAVSIWFWIRAQRKGIFFKIAAGVSFVPASLLSILASFLVLASFGCETATGPIYSPDHSKAVRIYNLDGGALGGNTVVKVFSHYGFWQDTIVRGYWHVVEPSDVHWLDSKHLSIGYDYFARDHKCSSTTMVKVDCIKNPAPPNSGSLQSPRGDETAELHKAKDGSYQGTDAVILTGSIGYAYVYVGDPNSVVWPETHWKGDHELEIAIRGDPKACSSQIGITVTCTHVETK